MKKSLILYLLLLVCLFSCGNKKSNQEKNDFILGAITFNSESQNILDIDLFESVDGKANLINPIPNKKQNAFNVANIWEDLKDNELYRKQIEEYVVNNCSTEIEKKEDGKSYYFYSRFTYSPSFISSHNSQFKELVLSNPLRYYSSEFIDDIKKLENGAINKDDVIDKYGLYYISSYSLYQNMDRKITITDINNRNNKDEIELIYNYYTSSRKSMSLENYTKVMTLINEYDIDINLSSAKGTYSFYEYLDNIYIGNNILGELVRKARNTSPLFLPLEYQKAANILGIEAC